MSKNDYCNPITRSDKSGKGLSRCEDRDDWTCPVQEPDMSDFSYWNSSMDPDKSRGLRKFEWSGHVRAGARYVQFCLLEPGQETNMFGFFGELDSKEFFDDLYFTNSPNVSPLIVQIS
jgi:hypothetical protein